jgi:hypothetical protein
VEHVPPSRQPNFVAFIGTGVVLGFVLGSAVGYYGSDPVGYGRSYSTSSAVLFLGALGACLLGLLGALVAVLVDRLLDRRR